MGELGGAEVGLPADRLVALDRALAAAGPDREAVVLGGDLDPPGRQVLDRVVGAAVAEGQLEGLEARPPGRAAGGRGRCRTRAACRPARGPSRRRSRAPPGRPGRWRGRPGRGLARARPRPSCRTAAASAGSRARGSWRMIESLMPVSMPTTWGPAPVGSRQLDRLVGRHRRARGRARHRAARRRPARAPRPRRARPGRSRRASRRGRGCGAPAPGCRRRRSPGPRSREASRASRPRRRRRPRRSSPRA